MTPKGGCSELAGFDEFAKLYSLFSRGKSNKKLPTYQKR